MPWRFFHRGRATFLDSDLRKSLQSAESKGTVSFDLQVQVRENVPDKSLVDATRTWSEKWVTVGRLDLDTFVDCDAEVAQLDALSFSPLHLCPGIEAHPDDKILAARAAAYPAAHVRRTEAKR
jgi:catalase